MTKADWKGQVLAVGGELKNTFCIGVDEHREVVVCERLSYDDEKIVRSTLKDIANSEFTYMCIMVIY